MRPNRKMSIYGYPDNFAVKKGVDKWICSGGLSTETKEMARGDKTRGKQRSTQLCEGLNRLLEKNRVAREGLIVAREDLREVTRQGL